MISRLSDLNEGLAQRYIRTPSTSTSARVRRLPDVQGEAPLQNLLVKRSTRLDLLASYLGIFDKYAAGSQSRLWSGVFDVASAICPAMWRDT